VKGSTGIEEGIFLKKEWTHPQFQNNLHLTSKDL
jgi:hypothetical protein